MTYDAEIYEGANDSDLYNHSTKSHINRTGINIATVSKYLNIQQQYNPTKQVYSLEELTNDISNTSILKMKMEVDKQQMDSGANKNVTDDRTIIRNYSDITPIAVFGIEKDEIACQIVGKGITELHTVDGSYMPITMYYSPGCAGTIISPNAIVRDNKNFTGWQQTSHLDTGKDDCKTQKPN